MNRIIEDFSYLRKTNCKGVYLDNAATTLCPDEVIDYMSEMQKYNFVNINRGSYKLAEETFEKYELAEKKILHFFGAENDYLFIQTTGATEAINIVARCFLEDNIKQGDVILISECEHHSNYLPWRVICEKKGAVLKKIPMDENGNIDIENALCNDNSDIKLVSITHVSNVLGKKQNVESIVEICKKNNIPVLIDGSQSVPHYKINFTNIGMDFFVCSAHKMLGPFGVGGLFVKKSIFSTMKHNYVGGGMVLDVDKLLWKDGTEKYMAGTPNTVGMLGWGATIDYLNKINVFSYNEHIKKLADLLYEYLKNKKEINVYTQDKDTASGIISFNINNIHPHDVNEFFRNENIMVRVGNHCSIPTMRYLGIKSCIRASIYIYNNEDDIKKIMNTIDKIIY